MSPPSLLLQCIGPLQPPTGSVQVASSTTDTRLLLTAATTDIKHSTPTKSNTMSSTYNQNKSSYNTYNKPTGNRKSMRHLLFTETQAPVAAPVRAEPDTCNVTATAIAEWCDLQIVNSARHRKTYQLKSHPVPGDGNCLFHSISTLLRGRMGYQELREKTVQYAREQYSLLRLPFAAMNSGPFDTPASYNRHLDTMSRNSEYGTTFEIVTMSNMLNITIIVWKDTNEYLECWDFSHNNTVFHLHNVGHNHFEPMVTSSTGILHGTDYTGEAARCKPFDSSIRKRVSDIPLCVTATGTPSQSASTPQPPASCVTNIMKHPNVEPHNQPTQKPKLATSAKSFPISHAFNPTLHGADHRHTAALEHISSTTEDSGTYTTVDDTTHTKKSQDRNHHHSPNMARELPRTDEAVGSTHDVLHPWMECNSQEIQQYKESHNLCKTHIRCDIHVSFIHSFLYIIDNGMDPITLCNYIVRFVTKKSTLIDQSLFLSLARMACKAPDEYMAQWTTRISQMALLPTDHFLLAHILSLMFKTTIIVWEHDQSFAQCWPARGTTSRTHIFCDRLRDSRYHPLSQTTSSACVTYGKQYVVGPRQYDTEHDSFEQTVDASDPHRLFKRPYKLRHVDVPKDGNCLFWTLAHVCGKPQLNHAKMRHFTCNQVAPLFDTYRTFLQQMHDRTFPTANEYFTFIHKRGQWGSLAEIKAIAEGLQITIIVWQNHAHIASCFTFGDGTHVEHIKHSGSEKTGHYSYLQHSETGEVYGTRYVWPDDGSPSYMPTTQGTTSQTIPQVTPQDTREPPTQQDTSGNGVYLQGDGTWAVKCTIKKKQLQMYRFASKAEADRVRTYFYYRTHGVSYNKSKGLLPESSFVDAAGRFVCDEKLDNFLLAKKVPLSPVLVTSPPRQQLSTDDVDASQSSADDSVPKVQNTRMKIRAMQNFYYFTIERKSFSETVYGFKDIESATQGYMLVKAIIRDKEADLPDDMLSMFGDTATRCIKYTINRHEIHSQKLQPSMAAYLRNYHSSLLECVVHPCITCEQLWSKTSMTLLSTARYEQLKEQYPGKAIFRDNTSPYMCNTCTHAFQVKRQLPLHCEANGFTFPQVHSSLSSLTDLEKRLLSLRIPFMTLQCPLGKLQSRLRGKVVNVPANVDTTITKIPRTPHEMFTVVCFLKRRMSDLHSVFTGTVSPAAIRTAAHFLCTQTEIYSELNIAFDESKLETYIKCGLPAVSITEVDKSNNKQDPEEENDADDSPSDDPNANYGCKDTLLQQLSYTDHNSPLVTAPGEGNTPTGLYGDEYFEEQAFPATYNGTKRRYSVKATNKQIDKFEIRNMDQRVAKNTEHIFCKYNRQQYKQLVNVISTQVRKDKIGSLKGIRAQDLLQNSRVHDLKTNHVLYNAFATVPGSPEYFAKTKKDLNAYIRQLGTPSFFVTISAADTRWDEMFLTLNHFDKEPVLLTDPKLVRKNRRKKTSKNNASESDEPQPRRAHGDLVNAHPVHCVRYYAHRKRCLLKMLTAEDCHILGGVQDYFFVDEFQNRGSPHSHGLLWSRNAPPPDADTETIVQFIDTHITTSSSDLNDDQLLKQTHKCTFTCSKSKRVRSGCRFSFPKFPMPRTMILNPLTEEEKENNDMPYIKSTLQEIRDALKKPEFNAGGTLDFAAFLRTFGITEDFYITVIRSTLRQNKKVLYKRDVRDVWINQYNKDLLDAWDANIDVQFTTQAHAAAEYVSGYISKGDRDISALLDSMTSAEPSNQGMATIKSLLYRAGASLMDAQEVSVQEAIYLLLGLSFRSATRHVIFVQTSPTNEQCRMLKPTKLLEDLPADSTDIFMPNVTLQRYLARKQSDMCLADWVSTQTVKINKDTGEDEERDRRHQCVIRYVNYKKDRDPTNYYRERCMLYVPFRDLTEIESEPEACFFKHETAIREKMVQYDSLNLDDEDFVEGPPIERLPDEEDDVINCIPEFAMEDQVKSDLDATKTRVNGKNHNITQEEQARLTEAYYKLMSSLNPEQRSIVDHAILHVRNSGDKQLKLFITGGAGVGKSRVLQAIYETLTRHYLSFAGANNSTPKVLKLAFTGIASWNIRGTTMQSTLHIPFTPAKLPTSLSPETRSAFRDKFRDVKAVLFDECSQISWRLLMWADKRFRELGNPRAPFGGFHVIFFGDLFQLLPVGGTPPFVPETGNILGLTENPFASLPMFELTMIMRQREHKEFAERLNRLREGKHTSSDIAFFLSLQANTVVRCVGDLNYKALFRSNKACDEYNTKCFNDASPADKRVIKADIKDHKRKNETTLPREQHKKAKPTSHHADPTVRTRNIAKHKHKQEKDNLGGYSEKIKLYKSGIVQVVANLDVKDGLANGSNGVVRHFSHDQNNEVSVVWVEFDAADIGRRKRVTMKHKYALDKQVQPNWTPLVRENKEVNRRKNIHSTVKQFPIREADGITIHKSQGLSLKSGYINFHKCCQEHLHYVAYSRFVDHNMVTIEHFDPSEIKVSPLVTAQMDRMRQDNVLEINHSVPFNLPDQTTFPRIWYQNVLTLKKSFSFFRDNASYLNHVDMLCLLETRHFPEDMDNYALPHFPHSANLPSTSPYGGNKSHGLIVFSKQPLQELGFINHNDFQCLTCIVEVGQQNKAIVMTVYVSPHPTSMSRNEIWSQINSHFLSFTHLYDAHPTIVCGDFNISLATIENHPKTFRTMLGSLQHHSFQQHVQSHTTIHKTMIDHVYSNISPRNITISHNWSYFSDHLPLLIIPSEDDIDPEGRANSAEPHCETVGK